jgi:hypothetical protein
MRGRIVQLKRISSGGPEQWEGTLSTGERVFVRERHGVVRIEMNDIMVSEKAGDDAYAALAELFEIANEAWEEI